MEEKNNVPELRFPEFSGVWEKHKLGDIEKEGKISLNRGNVIPKGDGPYPVYSSSVKNNGLMGYSNTYMFDRELVSWSIDGGGDFFYRPKHKFSVTNVSGYIDILDDTYLCYKYLAYELQFLHSFLHFDYQTKAHPSVIRELYTIAIPSVAEQEKIGAFISNLDNLIALHQRKLDDTKELKKCLLQKMFPKDGEDTPELRFPGFSVPWEQRKVSEITKFHKQGFYTTENYDSNKKYYLLRGTDITDNKLILKDTPRINATEADYQAFKTQVGDFLIVRSGTVGTYGIVYDDIPAIFGSYLIDFRFDMEQVTNEFFGYFYQSDSFKGQLRQIIQQSANTNINAENIKSTCIKLPALDEQCAISKFFLSLDTLITLHQRKLDALKALKRCTPQEMFI